MKKSIIALALATTMSTNLFAAQTEITNSQNCVEVECNENAESNKLSTAEKWGLAGVTAIAIAAIYLIADSGSDDGELIIIDPIEPESPEAPDDGNQQGGSDESEVSDPIVSLPDEQIMNIEFNHSNDGEAISVFLTSPEGEKYGINIRKNDDDSFTVRDSEGNVKNINPVVTDSLDGEAKTVELENGEGFNIRKYEDEGTVKIQHSKYGERIIEVSAYEGGNEITNNKTLLVKSRSDLRSLTKSKLKSR